MRFAHAARGLAALLFIVVGLAVTTPRVVASDGPLVFAAASLKNALDAAADAWIRETGQRVVISYAGSSALARQIERGAPADIFVSADLEWMAHLAAKGLVQETSVVKLLGNRIVLVAPATSNAAIEIEPGFDLAGLTGDGRLAMANTDAVPAGRYGKAALETLGVWESVRDRLARAENVRAALALVSTGEAPLGIVYETDAAADPDVRVVGRFPRETHPPVVYPAALVGGSAHSDAATFLKFLQSDTARDVFEAQGFSVLAPVLSN